MDPVDTSTLCAPTSRLYPHASHSTLRAENKTRSSSCSLLGQPTCRRPPSQRSIEVPADALVIKSEARTKNLVYVNKVANAIRVTGRGRTSAQFAVEVDAPKRNLAAEYKAINDAADKRNAHELKRTRLRRASKRARQHARDKRLKEQSKTDNPEGSELPEADAEPPTMSNAPRVDPG